MTEPPRDDQSESEGQPIPSAFLLSSVLLASTWAVVIYQFVNYQSAKWLVVGVVVTVLFVLRQSLVDWLRSWTWIDTRWLLAMIAVWTLFVRFPNVITFLIAAAVTLLCAYLTGFTVYKPASLLAASGGSGLATITSYAVLLALAWCVTGGMYFVLLSVLPPSQPKARFSQLAERFSEEDWRSRRSQIDKKLAGLFDASVHNDLTSMLDRSDELSEEKAKELITKEFPPILDKLKSPEGGSEAVAFVEQRDRISVEPIRLEYTDSSKQSSEVVQKINDVEKRIVEANEAEPKDNSGIESLRSELAKLKYQHSSVKDSLDTGNHDAFRVAVDLTKEGETHHLFHLDFRYDTEESSETLSCEATIFVPEKSLAETIQRKRTLQPITFFRMQSASRLTPHTYVVSTPASTHVFDRAIQFIFEVINKEEKDAFALIGYPKSDSAETQLKNRLSRVLKETLGGQVPADSGDEETTDSGSDITTVVSLQRKLNGPIQWATLFVFNCLMIHMIARWIVYCFLENNVLRSSIVNDVLLKRYEALTNDVVTEITTEAEAERTKVRNRASWGPWTASPAFLDLYIKAASAFSVSGDYTAVPAFLDSEAARILDERTARHALMKYLLWAIPTIGFVGTVVGIGDALLETINVDSISLVERSIAKSTVSSNIGVAFDTTLVALLLSLVGMFIYNVLVQFEELAIVRASSLTSEQFIRPGQDVSRDRLSEMMVEETKELIEQIYVWREAASGLDSLNTQLGEHKAALGSYQGISDWLRRLMLLLVFIVVATLGIVIFGFWDQIMSAINGG